MNTQTPIKTKTDHRVVVILTVGMISAFFIGYALIGFLGRGLILEPIEEEIIVVLPACESYEINHEDLGTLVETEVALYNATENLSNFISEGVSGGSLITQANTRKELLLQMMLIDPNTAKNYLLGDSDRLYLSQKTNNCVESDFIGTGTVGNLIMDFEEISYIDTRFVSATDDLHLAITNDSLIEKNKGEATIIGLILDDIVFVDSNIENNFIYSSPPVKTAATWIGEYPLVVLKFTANDSYDIPYELTDDKIIEEINTINDFYLENSFNQFSYTGVKNPDQPADIYEVHTNQDVGCDAMLIMDLAIASAGSKVSSITDPAVLVLYNLPPECGTGGTYTYDFLQNFNGVKAYAVWMYMRDLTDKNYDLDWFDFVAAHELGHTQGNLHASLFNHDIFTTTLDDTTCKPKRGITNANNTFEETDEEYGDHFDVMGRYSLSNYNAFNKMKTGWVNDTTLKTVTEDGTFRLGPAEFSPDETTNDIRYLQIPRSDDGNQFLYIEFRTPYGFDENMPIPRISTKEIEDTNVFDGALLHFEYPCDKSDGRIFDPHGGVPGVNFVNPALLPGESFTDPQTGIQVTVTGINKSTEGNYQDAWLDVEVTYPKTPKIISPPEGEVVGDTFELVTDILGGTGNEEIEYYVNDNLLATTTDRSVTVDTSGYADEETLILKAQAKGSDLNSTRKVLIERCYEGSNCIKAIHLYWNPSQHIEMTNGTTYEVSFWTKKGTADNARIFFGGNGWNQSCWAQDLSSEWTPQTCSITTPGTPSTSESVFMRVLSGGGADPTDPTLFSYIDDIKVYLNGENPKDSIVLNGGFEEGGTSWWMGNTYNPLVQTSPNRLCADVNNTGNVDIADITYLVTYMFKGGPAPFPQYSANVNGIGDVDVADLVSLVAYQFKGGATPSCYSTPIYSLPLGSNWNETEYNTWYNNFNN